MPILRIQWDDDLRLLNWERAKQFPGASITEWSAAEIGNAIAGETGELCNLLKKLHRGVDVVTPQQLMEEVGGVIVYLDLLCARINLPTLSKIVEYEFNRVSDKRSLPQFLNADNPGELLR